jgi:hypothetical protein
MTAHLKPVVTGDKRADLEDNPLETREAAQAISSRAQRIARVLGSPAAHPDVRAKAKDELVTLAREALELWWKI